MQGGLKNDDFRPISRSISETVIASPPMPVPHVTAHPSTASVPITVLLYNGLLLCGFNVPIKGLMLPVLNSGTVFQPRTISRTSNSGSLNDYSRRFCFAAAAICDCCL